MTTKHENIIAYVATQLATVPGITGVFRSRPEAVRKEELPCLLVLPAQDTADYNTMDFINWTMQFRIVILYAGAEPDRLADDIYSAVYTKMMTDRTLGGRCQDIAPLSVAYDIDMGDKPTLYQTCTFSCVYRTTATNLGA